MVVIRILAEFKRLTTAVATIHANTPIADHAAI